MQQLNSGSDSDQAWPTVTERHQGGMGTTYTRKLTPYEVLLRNLVKRLKPQRADNQYGVAPDGTTYDVPDQAQPTRQVVHYVGVRSTRKVLEEEGSSGGASGSGSGSKQMSSAYSVDSDFSSGREGERMGAEKIPKAEGEGSYSADEWVSEECTEESVEGEEVVSEASGGTQYSSTLRAEAVEREEGVSEASEGTQYSSNSRAGNELSEGRASSGGYGSEEIHFDVSVMLSCVLQGRRVAEEQARRGSTEEVGGQGQGGEEGVKDFGGQSQGGEEGVKEFGGQGGQRQVASEGRVLEGKGRVKEGKGLDASEEMDHEGKGGVLDGKGEGGSRGWVEDWRRHGVGMADPPGDSPDVPHVFSDGQQLWVDIRPGTVRAVQQLGHARETLEKVEEVMAEALQPAVVPEHVAVYSWSRRKATTLRSKEMILREEANKLADEEWAPGVELARDISRLHFHTHDVLAARDAAHSGHSSSLAPPPDMLAAKMHVVQTLASSAKLRSMAMASLQLPGSFQTGGHSSQAQVPQGGQSWEKEVALRVGSMRAGASTYDVQATLLGLLRWEHPPTSESPPAETGGTPAGQELDGSGLSRAVTQGGAQSTATESILRSGVMSQPGGLSAHMSMRSARQSENLQEGKPHSGSGSRTGSGSGSYSRDFDSDAEEVEVEEVDAGMEDGDKEAEEQEAEEVASEEDADGAPKQRRETRPPPSPSSYQSSASATTSSSEPKPKSESTSESQQGLEHAVSGRFARVSGRSAQDLPQSPPCRPLEASDFQRLRLDETLVHSILQQGRDLQGRAAMLGLL
eukprot:gene16661-22913_t